MALKFTGRLCLSDIPKELIKIVPDKDGNPKAWINISVHENKEPHFRDKKDENGNVIYGQDGKPLQILDSDHFISCAPKKEEQKEGTNYIFGNLRTWVERPQVSAPSAADIASAPSFVEQETVVNLPF